MSRALGPDEFEDMLNSAAWGLYREHMFHMQCQEIEDCLRPGVEPTAADVARGAVKALRRAASLPDMILDELRREKEEKR